MKACHKMTIIAAMTKGHVIGKDEKLPWHIPEDMKLFKQFTTGNTVIMGRKTYESIGRPLPNRDNIVVSSSMLAGESAVMCSKDRLIVCSSLDAAVERASKNNNEIFFIGGATIYEQALPLADQMYISYVKKDYAGDVYFPKFSDEDWVVEERKDYAEFEWVRYSFRMDPL